MPVGVLPELPEGEAGLSVGPCPEYDWSAKTNIGKRVAMITSVVKSLLIVGVFFVILCGCGDVDTGNYSHNSIGKSCQDYSREGVGESFFCFLGHAWVIGCQVLNSADNHKEKG